MRAGVYFYEKDWDLLTTAKAISAQPWDRSFFKNLRSEHQCHYEQGGVMTGKFFFLCSNPELICITLAIINGDSD
jgi:hypothetical protein